jgi:hypothetical protein
MALPRVLAIDTNRSQVIDGHTNGTFEDLQILWPLYKRSTCHAVARGKVSAPGRTSSPMRIHLLVRGRAYVRLIHVDRGL